MFNNPLLNSLVGSGSPIKSKLRRLSADSDDFEHTWEIDHDLYKRNETDLDLDKLHVTWFGKSQNRRRPSFCQLEVTCIKAEELDISNSTARHCDPYVVLAVAGQMHKTKEHRRKFNPFWYKSFSSNPFFDETFTFSNVNTREKIRIEVRDFDHALLGLCDVSVSQLLEFDADLIDVERVLPISSGRLICSFRIVFPKSPSPRYGSVISKEVRQTDSLNIRLGSNAVASMEPENTPETSRQIGSSVAETSEPVGTPPRKESVENQREGSPEAIIVSEDLFSMTPSRKSHESSISGVLELEADVECEDQIRESGSRSRASSCDLKATELERPERANSLPLSALGRRASESSTNSLPRGRRASESIQEIGRRESEDFCSSHLVRSDDELSDSFEFRSKCLFRTKCLIVFHRIQRDEANASLVLENDFLEITALIELGCLSIESIVETLTLPNGELDFLSLDTLLARLEPVETGPAAPRPMNRKVSYEISNSSPKSSPKIEKNLAAMLKRQVGISFSVSPERKETITPEPPDEDELAERIEFFSYIDHDLPETSREPSRDSSPEPSISMIEEEIPKAADFFRQRRDSKQKANDRKPIPTDWGSVIDMLDDVSDSDDDDSFAEDSIPLAKSRRSMVIKDPTKRKSKPKKKSTKPALTRPSFSKTRQIMAKRREEVRRKQKEMREKQRKQRKPERKLGPRDIGRKSKKSYQMPDYDIKEADDFLAPRLSLQKRTPNTRNKARKLGPRDIGRKSKKSWVAPKYEMRKESFGIYRPRIQKITRPPRAPRKLGPRDIGRKSKLSYVMPEYDLPNHE